VLEHVAHQVEILLHGEVGVWRGNVNGALL